MFHMAVSKDLESNQNKNFLLLKSLVYVKGTQVSVKSLVRRHRLSCILLCKIHVVIFNNYIFLFPTFYDRDLIRHNIKHNFYQENIRFLFREHMYNVALIRFLLGVQIHSHFLFVRLLLSMRSFLKTILFYISRKHTNELVHHGGCEEVILLTDKR